MKRLLKMHARHRGAVKAAAGLIGLVLLVTWSGGCFRRELPPGVLQPELGLAVPPDAETVQVAEAALAPRIDVVGTVASEEKVHLSARLSAYVSRVHVSAGDRVSRGQVLIELDDRELKEQLAAAQAQLEQARTEYERAQKLMQADATTEQALTAARSAYESAQARVKQIDVMLSYTQITSPLDGMVTDRRVEAGDLANPGEVLLTVYDPRNMRLDVPVPVRLAEKLQVGQRVPVELDRPARPFEGEVTEVVAEIDPQSRTQLVKVHIHGAGGEVLPGTFGRVWVEGDPRPAILAPRSAVYRVGQLELVHVLRNGRAVRRLVKTGPARGDEVEILAGLSDGDIVLKNPVRG